MRHQKSQDRYQQDKGSKFMQYISKELVYGRGSTYDKSRSRTNSRVFANNTKIKPNDSFQVSDVYSQPQLVKQRRGASILRSNSKNKCRDSMSKFRKDFVKEASFNFYEGKQFKQTAGSKLGKEKRVKSTKDDTSGSGMIGMIFDQELDVEEIHYQMAKMHQNVKLMQKQT